MTIDFDDNTVKYSVVSINKCKHVNIIPTSPNHIIYYTAVPLSLSDPPIPFYLLPRQTVQQHLWQPGFRYPSLPNDPKTHNLWFYLLLF